MRTPGGKPVIIAGVAWALRTGSRRTWQRGLEVRRGEVKDASVDRSTVIGFLCLAMVLQVLLPGVTRPTWAYPAYYPQALAFSVFPRLRPPTRLAVRSARSRAGRGWQRFQVLQPSLDDLGSPYPPAVRMFASGHCAKPEPDCVPFGPSRISLFGLTQFTMLAGVHLI